MHKLENEGKGLHMEKSLKIPASASQQDCGNNTAPCWHSHCKIPYLKYPELFLKLSVFTYVSPFC